MGTRFGCSDFWDRMGGKELVVIARDDIQGNHSPIISNAFPPKQS